MRVSKSIGKQVDGYRERQLNTHTHTNTLITISIQFDAHLWTNPPIDRTIDRTESGSGGVTVVPAMDVCAGWLAESHGTPGRTKPSERNTERLSEVYIRAADPTHFRNG